MSSSKHGKEKRNVLIDHAGCVEVQEYDEDDDFKRTADISIYSTILELSQPSSGSGSVSLGAVLPFEPFMHQGVIVKFKDGLTYTFDGDTRDGLFMGEFVVWVKKGEPEKDCVQSLRHVGSTCCSPHELIMRARESSKSRATYNFLLSNCQTWAQEFCKDLLSGPADNLPLTSKDAAVTAVTATAVLGAIAWGISNLFEYRQENKKKQNSSYTV